MAVAIGGDAVTYAHALVGLESSRPARLSPALAASGGSLPERIARLLGQSTRRSCPRPGPGAAVVAVLIVGATWGLFGQPVVRPSFEAASIKPNNLGAGHVREHASTGRLDASMTTKDLIEEAFGIREFQISGGPAWLGSDSYDILATTGSPAHWTNKILEPYLRRSSPTASSSGITGRRRNFPCIS